MATPPPNPDTRELPYGWIQQYNWEFRQWFYVNTRENPPRSGWEHPLGPIPQGYAPPLGPPPSRSPYGGPPGPPPPPPDRSYNRSPYGGPPPPPQGYGGYGASPQGYNNTPAGGYLGGGSYGSGNRGYSPGAPSHTVYVEEQAPQQRKFGLGTAVAAGGAGLLGGVLLTEAFEKHNEHEREEGYDQGFDAGMGQGDQGGGDQGGDGGDW
ncbi:hypothetical protein V8E55_002300 [Tylopilus felleus]